jgi:hypothetical protein
MVEPVAQLNQPLFLQTPEILDNKISQLVLSPKTDLKISKQDVRSTLKASTLDGVFATVFESAIGGVLLSNFLLQLGASSVEIGIFSAIPMVVNLLQPLGAYIADRTTSRYWYNQGYSACPGCCGWCSPWQLFGFPARRPPPTAAMDAGNSRSS